MADTKRKPRAKVTKPKEIAEQVEKPLINEAPNEEELLKDPDMKDPEIVENQGIPSADEVAALAKEAENTLEIAEIKPEVVEPEEEIAENDEEVAENGEEIAENDEESSDEITGELAAADTPEEGDTILPENVVPFVDYRPKGIPAEVFKLNPNLDDSQSKWLARIVVGGAIHKIFKGSYAKAYNAAKNYNVLHGLKDAEIKKVRN